MGKDWALLAALLAVLGLVEWTDRPPRPQPADAPATSFSEARALPTVEELTGTIGYRVTGTPSARVAADWLEQKLRALPRWEVQVQEDWTCGPDPFPGEHSLALFHPHNVIARLPGRSREAILVSAHYDSPVQSVGAADDGVNVATMLELARVFAGRPTLDKTLIFNFNDGEEAGLYGSFAFARHPWIKDVQVFLNLEASGARGKAILFQVGPGDAWLAKSYARGAKWPYGSVLGQDIFQGGLIPSDTDFRNYRDFAGLRGLDMAYFEDGYAYHTNLDRMERLEPGSLQQMGDNVLGILGVLSAQHLPAPSATRAVYYDVLGWFMVTYSAHTGVVLALWGMGLVVLGLALALLRRRLSSKDLLRGMGRVLLAFLLAVVLPVAVGLALSYLLRRPHGWYAAPWLARMAFGGWTLVGLWLGWRVFRGPAGEPDEEGRRALAGWGASLLLFVALTAITTKLGAGSSYLFSLWALFGGAAFLLAVLTRFSLRALVLVGSLPGMVVGLQVGKLLLELVAPLTGILRVPVPVDFVVAAVVAVPLALVVGALLSVTVQARESWIVLGLGFVLGLGGTAGLALRFPYSAENRQRVTVERIQRGADSAFAFSALDGRPLERALAKVPGAHPAQTVLGTPQAPGTWEAPAPVGMTQPGQVKKVSEREEGEGRAVTLELTSEPGATLDVRVPAGELLGTTLQCPLVKGTDGVTQLRVVAANREGIQLTLHLPAHPVHAEVWMHPGGVPSSVTGLRASFPEWVEPQEWERWLVPLEL